jgi:hypothetical protein
MRSARILPCVHRTVSADLVGEVSDLGSDVIALRQGSISNYRDAFFHRCELFPTARLLEGEM